MDPIPITRGDDDRLYVENIRILACDASMRLHKDVIWALDAAGYRRAFDPRARIRVCAVCRAPYIGDVHSLYCSDACRQVQKTETMRDQIERRSERRAKRRNRAKCDICDATFEPHRDGGRYCSQACRQRAYRQRR